ncbi:MAG: hypothetical protein JNK15_18210 [Planctomycetes bacterium]|nr:hypothetical protein [Planctomycetota bacterium]
MPFPYIRSFTVLGVLTAAALAQSPGYDKAAARYRELMDRVTMQHHTEARETLSRTRCAPALATLVADYGKPKAFPEDSRYMLAHLIGQAFDKTEFADTLMLMRGAHSGPGDVWLWVTTLRNHANMVGEDDVIAIATDSKNALHRAAAITAIGLSKKGSLKKAIVPTCVQFPKKDREADRMLLVGAMSGAFYENKSRVNDAEYREALTAYIGLLGEDVALPPAAKLQVARHLQWILKGPSLFDTPEPWLELLQRGDVKKSTHSTVTAPRFFGVETDGDRFCYVIDMSDSMCKAVSPNSKPTGPVTGGKPVKKKREMFDETDIPWAKVQNRWDLAREQLRISLYRLTPDKSFSVVWFGTGAGTLDSTKGMVRATKANVDKALAELDAIKVGERDENTAPDGKLRGRTSLHGGLRRAFGICDKGIVAEFAYVDPAALTDGCDTIFLLSDGAPSMDDFEGNDKDYGEGQVVVDNEYNKPAARTARLNYPGPYVQPDWILTDFRRMNAFRRVRLHCVGLGEADMGLLRQLAEAGNGQMFVFGDKKAAPASGPTNK